jgi:hypothetical protein
MYIAIACALTGQTQRQTAKGRLQISGWDQWENHKAKWETEAKGLGRTTTFVPWTAPDLEAKLTEPKMVVWSTIGSGLSSCRRPGWPHNAAAPLMPLEDHRQTCPPVRKRTYLPDFVGRMSEICCHFSDMALLATSEICR